MKILATGLTGLVGSRLVELLQNHQFENISTSTGVDITNTDQVFNAISSSSAEIVLHLAAKTNVDSCEEDKKEDLKILGQEDSIRREQEWSQKKTAWAVNTFGTQNIVRACEKTKKKFFFVSTDFVFDGDAPPQNGYTEDIIPCAINWYGQTKLEAENITQKATIPWTIIRIGFPYCARGKKSDLLRTFLTRLTQKQPIAAVIDQIITPTFIDDIALAINTLITHNATGIYHVVGSQSLTPFDVAQTVAKKFNLDSSGISKITRNEFYKNKAPRPFQLKVNNDKISQLDISMKTFEQGVEEIKRQLEN
jgi:dTDP-4-dehydrorhamnose reductase